MMKAAGTNPSEFAVEYSGSFDAGVLCHFPTPNFVLLSRQGFSRFATSSSLELPADTAGR
jgi:hypothetical protein